MASPFQFEDLMSIAQRNTKHGQKQIKSFVPPPFSASKPKPPQTAKEKQLSEGVRKFLEKKQEEERLEAEKKRREKERLLQLRQQDKKANRRVNAMLKMTKSASKSCMDDAQDSLSDSLAQQGEIQPDEDDYGYVSEYSQKLQRMYMEKYKATPTPKPAVPRTMPPPPTPNSLTSKTKAREFHDDDLEYSKSKPKEPEIIESAKKKKAPPPMNFQEMMELAKKVSQEPVQFAKPIIPKSKEKEAFEFGRPMTAKEKAAFMKEKACKERAIAKFNNVNSTTAGPSPASDGDKVKNGFKIPSKKKSEPTKSPEPSSTSSKPKSQQDLSGGSSKMPSTGSTGPSAKSSSKPAAITPPSISSSQKKPTVLNASQSELLNKAKGKVPNPSSSTKSFKSVPVQETSKSVNFANERREQPKQVKMASAPTTAKDINRNVERPVLKAQKPSSSRPENGQKMGKRLPPPPHPNPYHFSNQIRPMKRRQVIESDEEYDSEMDDFIDDDDEPTNYSDMIRAITGYDRRKYRDIDEDDIQESSVFEQWKEERRSEKIGRMEDEIERRREEEELKRKAEMKKKMRRRVTYS